MRFFTATFLLLWSSSVFAASASAGPIAALVTGDFIRPDLVVASADVVGLTDDGQLLTQGLATRNGQSVQFIALLDQNNQVQFSVSDGDTWPEGGLVADVHASQLLFDGSFLVQGTSSGRPIIYRIDPIMNPSIVFDCETPSLNETFCAETTPPKLTHDSTGTVLLVAENSAWRMANQTYLQVFDFQVGAELPLSLGTLVDGASCTGQPPIADWMLDAKGGVVAVVYTKPAGAPPGPVVMRESIDGEFSVDVVYADDDRWRIVPRIPDQTRCGMHLKGVDLNGLVFTHSFGRLGSPPAHEQTFWVLEDESQYIELRHPFAGAVSGLYSTGEIVFLGGYPDWKVWMKRAEPFDDDRLIVDFIMDASRGAAPAAVLELSDGAKILVSGFAAQIADRKVLAEGDEISIRSAPWTVSEIRFTAFTSALHAGSATSNGALAFVISDAITGKSAILRMAPTAEFVANSTNDLSTVSEGECLTNGRVWDGRRECTVRAAFEAAATRDHTRIFASFMRLPFAEVLSPLLVFTKVELYGFGIIRATQSDLIIVQGGSLKVADIQLGASADCVQAKDANFLKFIGARVGGGRFGIRSIRSGPVEITGGSVGGGQLGVYVDGLAPAAGPLLKLNSARVNGGGAGVYATGSITSENVGIRGNRGPGMIMDGTDSDEMIVRLRPEGPGGYGAIAENEGAGVVTRRGKLIIDGPVLFEDNLGHAIDAAGPVEFRDNSNQPARFIRGHSGYLNDCRDVDFVDHEPVFDFRRCDANGIRLRSLEPITISNVLLSRTDGPGIIADGPITLTSVQFSEIGGPGVFSGYSGAGPAITLGDDTLFADVGGPVVQTTSGDVLVNGNIKFDGNSGGFDVGGNIIFSPTERVVIQGLGNRPCKFWKPQSERPIAKKCGFAPMISHATAGTNIFENIDLINNRGVAIWAESMIELRNVTIKGNDGGVIASSPDDAIILHEHVRILGNRGPGLVAKEGNIRALAPFRVEHNEGAGVIVQNGDFLFENYSETPGIIRQNAAGDNCAPVGNSENYPVYERCIRAGLFTPNGSVISSGLEVTENTGDGIAADQVDLFNSTVCGNSGAEIVSRTETLDDVDVCNKIVERASNLDDDGCSSSAGFLSPMMLLSLIGFRRRR